MEDLTGRTRSYSFRIIKLYEALPWRGATGVMRDQMLRSGTSVGAHYREASRSRSTAEFAAKLNAGLMELEERLYWLELIEGSCRVSSEELASLKNETGQLTAIFVTMIRNAKS